jgi:hypothetical protein
MELDEAIRGMSHLQIIQRLSLKEKGMILIKLKDGSHQFTSDVYYILTVKSNILSLDNC